MPNMHNMPTMPTMSNMPTMPMKVDKIIFCTLRGERDPRMGDGPGQEHQLVHDPVLAASEILCPRTRLGPLVQPGVLVPDVLPPHLEVVAIDAILPQLRGLVLPYTLLVGLVLVLMMLLVPEQFLVLRPLNHLILLVVIPELPGPLGGL